MAGQPDTSDDLISELARLMAQDANGETPTEPNVPTFAVRIPGSDNVVAPGPVPRFDNGTLALAADQSSAPSTSASSASTPSVAASPEPFDFDFGLGPASSKQAQSAAAETFPASEDSDAAPPAMAAVSTVDHDSIADLIAAELSANPGPAAMAAGAAAAANPQGTGSAHLASQLPATGAANVAGQPKQSLIPRAAPSQPTPRPEQDRFKVPPVFGVGTRPAAVEPAVGSSGAQPVSRGKLEPVATVAPTPAQPQDHTSGGDPIGEIESLIGRAMRVELGKPAEAAAGARIVASPALQSLAATTPAAAATPAAAPPPVVSPSADQSAAQGSLSGVDEAIFAAAQATGADLGWVEASEVNEQEAAPFVRHRPRRSFRLSRSVAGPLVAVTLLLAAGFGLYWALGLGRDAGPVPLLTADTGPIKETPAVEASAAVDQQSVVFNEIDGVVPGAEEQLVSRDQADVDEVTLVPPTTDLSEEGLANRRVRTVTVRPDGTIVSGEDSVAGSAILPVDRPNVPAVPGAETASPELLASVEAQPVNPGETPLTAETPLAPEAGTLAPEPAATEPVTPAVTAAPVVPVEPGSIVPAVDATGTAIPGRTAPVPVLRPTDLQATAPSIAPTSPVNAVVEDAEAGGTFLPPPPANSTLAPAPVAAAAQPEAALPEIPGAVEVEALPNTAPAYAQLASLRSEAEARQAAQNLVTRFGPVFGGANMEVQRVDLGTRGIYYRVRVPAESAQAASNICTNVIAAGGDCVPM
jgi:hypothetical protein